MKIYISGAITGTSDYMERFAAAEKMLTESGYIVINPAKVMSELPVMKYEQYMEISMLLLSMCSMVYMLNGWERSTGANREYGYALAKELMIIKEK